MRAFALVFVLIAASFAAVPAAVAAGPTAAASAEGSATGAGALNPNTRFWAPSPNPGASDQIARLRWTNGPKDPYRGIRDPDAGAWFPALALELARNADPAF